VASAGAVKLVGIGWVLLAHFLLGSDHNDTRRRLLFISAPNKSSTMNGNGEGGAVGAEKINTDIVTLTRFLTEEQAKHKEATGDLT